MTRFGFLNSLTLFTLTFVSVLCRDQTGLVRSCAVVGAEAAVAAADSLDSGEIWYPR